MQEDKVKKEIFDLIEKFFSQEKEKEFIPGKTKIGVGFPCYGSEEIISAMDSLLDLRLSQGKKVEIFEKEYSKYIGTKYGVAVNSGSSANLLAIAALIMAGKVKKGSEAIAPSATFTTVISPIIQNGLTPVFVDVDKYTYNISPELVKDAINENTGLIMPVHSFGCPANMEKIMKIANENNLPVLEDCCEAHGSAISGKKVGSFGTISTYSFFVAHNMTTGEGGMIMTSDAELDSILRSIREFGRLKEYEEGKPRFCYTDETLKEYDERYVFENIGYNVRMSDICAALGIEQLKKLDELNNERIKITDYYTGYLKKYEKYLQLPITPENGFHSFYGYVIFVKEDAPFTRTDIVRFLEKYGIETRAFMGGNLAIQPAYKNEKTKISNNLENTEKITDNVFFIGCHPQINKQQREYITTIFDKFFQEYREDE